MVFCPFEQRLQSTFDEPQISIQYHNRFSGQGKHQKPPNPLMIWPPYQNLWFNIGNKELEETTQSQGTHLKFIKQIKL